MNGPFAEEYWEAACLEVLTLKDMDAWEVVEQTDDMNVLPSTWAFKAKQFPDGLTALRVWSQICDHFSTSFVLGNIAGRDSGLSRQMRQLWKALLSL